MTIAGQIRIPFSRRIRVVCVRLIEPYKPRFRTDQSFDQPYYMFGIVRKRTSNEDRYDGILLPESLLTDCPAFMQGAHYSVAIDYLPKKSPLYWNWREWKYIGIPLGENVRM